MIPADLQSPETAPLKTSWEVQKAIGEPPAVIRAKNLKSTITGPQDAWGRWNVPQPIVVSAEVSVDEPFGSSASSDSVSHDTVHYGHLSKCVLGTIQRANENMGNATTGSGLYSLRKLLDSFYDDLTGLDANGSKGGPTKDTILGSSIFRHLSITVVLPKASLLGGGVGLVSAVEYRQTDEGLKALQRSIAAKIYELRIPTLIGVNTHERRAKQIVVASVEVDRLSAADIKFDQLEAVTVKAMEDSSFDTLEALSSYLAVHITSHLKQVYEAPPDGQGWRLKICLEKPTAVTLADAACVELRVNTNDVSAPS